MMLDKIEHVEDRGPEEDGEREPCPPVAQSFRRHKQQCRHHEREDSQPGSGSSSLLLYSQRGPATINRARNAPTASGARDHARDRLSAQF